MTFKENLIKQMNISREIQEKHFENLNKTRDMQLKLVSPTYNLIKESNLQNNTFINLQSEMGAENSSEFYRNYVKNREEAHKNVQKLRGTKNLEQPFQSVLNTLNHVNSPTPFELLLETTFNENEINNINEELSDIDWNDLRYESSIDDLNPEFYYIDFTTKNPEEFASKLYEHVEEINNDFLNSIFTSDFLKEITKSWWINPRLNLSEYVKLSERNITNNDLNQLFIGKYYFNPELLYTLVKTWTFEDDSRAKIIMQAFENYYNGNYEICVLTLLLQIEGLIRDKLKLTHTSGRLRNELEKRLDNYLENLDSDDSYYIFLIKSFKTFLWMILNPLDDKVDFIDDTDEINRNISAHVGKIEADQKIAIRLFLIIDTLMFILEVI